jgi:hypothetical protein
MTTPATRRTILLAAAGLAAAGAAVAAPAAGTMAKDVAKYQDKPGSGGATCDKCRYWIAGKTAKANGQCQLVVSPISPNGWCMLYAAK